MRGWASGSSNNHILQAQQIRGFIASRGRLAPRLSTTRILLFWIQAAEAGKAKPIEGFRLYRGVAQRCCAIARHYAMRWRPATSRRTRRGLEAANEDFTSDQVDCARAVAVTLRALTLPPADT